MEARAVKLNGFYIILLESNIEQHNDSHMLYMPTALNMPPKNEVAKQRNTCSSQVKLLNEKLSRF